MCGLRILGKVGGWAGVFGLVWFLHQGRNLLFTPPLRPHLLSSTSSLLCHSYLSVLVLFTCPFFYNFFFFPVLSVSIWLFVPVPSSSLSSLFSPLSSHPLTNDHFHGRISISLFSSFSTSHAPSLTFSFVTLLNISRLSLFLPIIHNPWFFVKIMYGVQVC